MNKKIFSILALVFILSGNILPQSFKTSRLKDSELFKFFESLNTGSKNSNQIKIEKTFGFFADFIKNSKMSSALPTTELGTAWQDCAKNWSKNKLLYFVFSQPSSCNYNSLAKTVEIGNKEEFETLKLYLTKGIKQPVILDKVFRTEIRKKTPPGDTINNFNEFILCLNILNSGPSFSKLFNNGVFSIKKEFESEYQLNHLLQECQVVLGVKIPGREEVFIKKDNIESGSSSGADYNLFHLGISGFIKRVILFNKSENKIISDIFVE